MGIQGGNGSTPKITNVKIINNSSGSGGGGITCGGNTNPVLKNVLIMGNNVGSNNHGG